MNRFHSFAYKVSQNNTRTCWVLKCDIRKFFASIDQTTLMDIVTKYILDKDIIWLIEQVVSSFNSGTKDKGLPLGNLTSQLLVNVYMNEFDQFIKHKTKAKYYIRYADDFVILSHDKEWLLKTLRLTARFLQQVLNLNLHPDKVFIKTLSSGVDFLGWVHFSDHKVLRIATKRRMLKNVAGTDNKSVIDSYLGLLKHGNARKLHYLVESKRK